MRSSVTRKPRKGYQRRNPAERPNVIANTVRADEEPTRPLASSLQEATVPRFVREAAREMSPIAEIRGLLIADRERTADLISSLSGNISSMVEASRLTTSDDEHDPEGSTIAFERSQASTLLAAARDHLTDVDAALARIAAGSYGRCERCGQEVARDRLLARPTARTCIGCAAGG